MKYIKIWSNKNWRINVYHNQVSCKEKRQITIYASLSNQWIRLEYQIAKQALS